MRDKGILALSDGSLFYGKSVGITGDAIGELIFNTSMTGYQEILTDPSYFNQIITFTSSHIGNTGVNSDDMESTGVWASGVIVRDISNNFSNWRGQKNLAAFLKEQNIVALTEIDTRRLTHLIRERGNLIACLLTGNSDTDFAFNQIKSFTAKMNHSTQFLTRDIIQKISNINNRFHVVVIDCGIKTSMLNHLIQLKCDLTIVPANISFDEIFDMKPDGILLSNGPGDPRKYEHLVDLTCKILNAQIPFFGICLGHQILALACGAKIYKMHFGQHGANHPIYDEMQNKVFISSQNHNYSVVDENFPNDLTISYRSLFDGSIIGLICNNAPAFSFQGHPEANPGPHDCSDMFAQFVYLIEKHHAKTH